MVTGRVGKVHDLERERVERLARELVPQLRESGQVVRRTADIEDVVRWRRAARRAGRLLGWRVRTALISNGSRVMALSDDWPIPPGAERAAFEAVAWAVRSSELPPHQE